MITCSKNLGGALPVGPFWLRLWPWWWNLNLFDDEIRRPPASTRRHRTYKLVFHVFNLVYYKWNPCCGCAISLFR